MHSPLRARSAYWARKCSQVSSVEPLGGTFSQIDSG